MPNAFFQKPLKVRILRGFVLAISLSLAAAFTPTPYHLQAPGRVERVTPMVEIKTKTYPSQGAFLLPTVVSEPATVLYVIYSLLDPNATLSDKSSAKPMAQTRDEQQMGASQYLATRVALKALGYELGKDDSELPFTISFDTGETSGASGGLVFALEIYSQLTPQDITKGRLIAATGTLSPRGRVGDIEGINLKLIGAAQAGADVFLVPRGNLDEIEGLPEGMQVIAVGSFNEALDALEKL